MGHRKSSAALLIVCEHIFYCLARTILVRTKDDELLKRVLVPGGGGGVLTYYGKRGSAALMGDFSAKSP